MSRIMNIKIRYPAFFDIWEDRSIVGKEFDLSEIVRDREILIFTKY